MLNKFIQRSCTSHYTVYKGKKKGGEKLLDREGYSTLTLSRNCANSIERKISAERHRVSAWNPSSARFESTKGPIKREEKEGGGTDTDAFLRRGDECVCMCRFAGPAAKRNRLSKRG